MRDFNNKSGEGTLRLGQHTTRQAEKRREKGMKKDTRKNKSRGKGRENLVYGRNRNPMSSVDCAKILSSPKKAPGAYGRDRGSIVL